MPWVRFTADHWHRLSPQVKRRYMAGQELNVPRKVADAAVALDRAVRLRKASKYVAPEVIDGEKAKRR